MYVYDIISLLDQVFIVSSNRVSILRDVYENFSVPVFAILISFKKEWTIPVTLTIDLKVKFIW